MSHKTMIDGVAYEVSGGKALIDGTAFSIKNGKTLVGGTAYEVGFGGYEILRDFGDITTTKILGYYYGDVACIFDLTDCNAFMVDGVLYEASTMQFEDSYFYHTTLRPNGAPTASVATADYPYSCQYSQRKSDGTSFFRLYSYVAGTYSVSVGKIK